LSKNYPHECGSLKQINKEVNKMEIEELIDNAERDILDIINKLEVR